MFKNIKKKLFLLMFLVPFLASAQSSNSINSTETVYINNNGVAIPTSTYNNLRYAYSDVFLSVVSQEDYDAIIAKGYDYSTIRKVGKYYRVEQNIATGEVTNIEVTEEEYNSSTTMSINRGDFIETAYKYVVLGVTGGGTSTSAILLIDCLWKIMPSVRSFDVSGFRLGGLSVVSGTQSGYQMYTTGGSTQYVSYAWNGTNINKQSNGFGISMNLVDSSVTYLETAMTADVVSTSTAPIVHATYQHAIRNVTLAQSKNYTISSAGLGDVLNFAGSIDDYYDGMQGLWSAV